MPSAAQQQPLKIFDAHMHWHQEANPFHGPDHWKWPPGRLDQWGVTPPHTQRWKRIQSLYGFAPDAYRL